MYDGLGLTGLPDLLLMWIASAAHYQQLGWLIGLGLVLATVTWWHVYGAVLMLFQAEEQKNRLLHRGNTVIQQM